LTVSDQGKEIQMPGEMRLELVQVPVSDIDRAKSFYVDKVGFHADHDHQVSGELRFVQLTPPGSACSIALTSGFHQMTPGVIEGLQMVVDDAEACRKELVDRGVEASDVQEFPWGNFVYFKDPDGNGWACQAIPQRSG
jgi:catechol 2,3-dioxygenase-like lactoylglutathione lyase family enzyme